MNVLIVDDHDVVRAGVRRLLDPLDDIVVTEAATARDAATIFRSDRPDIILLDLNLPKASGLELLRRFLLEDRSTRVLIFSMHAEPLYVARALDAGARGYVSKSAAANELVTAIRCLANGGRYVEREIAAQLVLAQYSNEDPLHRLSTREADILRLLGEGRTLAMIATALGVSYKTIANSCSVIKGKLGVERVTDLIRFAIEMRDA